MLDLRPMTETALIVVFRCQREYFHVFKQGRRRFASHAIVNAAMRVKLKATLRCHDIDDNKVNNNKREGPWIVEELGVVYGGLCSTPSVASKTMDALAGRCVSCFLQRKTKLHNLLKKKSHVNNRGSLPKSFGRLLTF